MGWLSSILTSAADDSLLTEALHEGGLTIRTFNDTGQIEFRTVLQLDGDMLIQIAPDSTLPEKRRKELAAQHLQQVTAKTHALNEALGRLEGLADNAKRYLEFAITLTHKGGLPVSLLSTALQHPWPALVVAVTALIVNRYRKEIVGFALRYVLRRLKTWATAEIEAGPDSATPAVRIEPA